MRLRWVKGGKIMPGPGGRRNQAVQKPKDARGTFARLMSYLSVYKWILLVVLILCVISNIMQLMGPSLSGAAIDEAAAGAGKVNFDNIFYYCRLLVVFYGVSSILTIVIHLIMTYISKLIGKKMRKDIFDKLMRLPVKYFDKNAAGDIISHASYDVDVVCTCLSTDIAQILTNIVTICGSLIMMIMISPLMASVMLIIVPVSIAYVVHMRKITQPLYRKRSDKYGVMNGFVEEMFTGQKTIQAYAYEDQIEDQFDEVNKDAAEAYRIADAYGTMMGPMMGGIGNIGMSVIAVLGAFLYMGGMVTIGNVSSFVMYTRRFTGPINEIANIVNQLYSALAAAERIFTLLGQPEESEDAEDAVILDNVRGDVKLDHVKFGYDPGRTILHDLSLDADAGKVIAIVGHTGAGKTTIVNLLMRFYDVDSGRITVDDGEIRYYTRSSLRRAYAMVLQDTWVFQGTIFENIAYGKEDATMEEVVEVAKKAHIHPFIMRLPNGYDTVITEDGTNISKGQKQLLTIARAMLYDCKMLILDEATSNVDTSTERAIQGAMLDLMKDKTCFVIAHRLSTIRNADWILVVDHGDVVEQGTHESLMKAGGFYSQLYNSQFE